MPAATITCTECGAALRVAARPEPGKKLKCPKCQGVFVVPSEDDEAEDQAPKKPAKARPNGAAPAKIAAKPIPPKRGADEDEDEAPRKPVKARRPVDEDDEDEKPVRASRRDDDDDDEEGFVRRKPKRKSKKRKSSNTGMVLGVAVAGILLLILIGGGAVTAFVWPGFLVSGENKGTGNELPLAYIPVGHNMAFAFRPDALEQVGLLSKIENQGDKDIKELLGSLKKNANLSLKDFEVIQLSGRAQPVLQPLPPPTIGGAGPRGGGGPGAVNPRQPGAPGGMPAPPTPTGTSDEFLVVLKAKAPFKQADILKCAKDPERKRHEGKTYYTMKATGTGGPTLLFMPNNQLIIVAAMAEEVFKAVVASDGTQLKSTGVMLSLLNDFEKSSAWLVTTGTDMMKMAGGPMMGGMPGQANANAPAPIGVGAGVNVDASGAAVRAAIQFPDANAAKTTAAEAEKQLAQLGMMAAMAGPGMAQDFKTLKVSAEGSQVVLTCQISKATIDSAVQMMDKPGGPMGGPGGPPPGGMPPDAMPQPGGPGNPPSGRGGRNRGTGGK